MHCCLQAQPKHLGSFLLSGPVLAGLTEAYVQAINNGAVPTIATAWQVCALFAACVAMEAPGMLVRRSRQPPMSAQECTGRRQQLLHQVSHYIVITCSVFGGFETAVCCTPCCRCCCCCRLQGVAEQECRRAADIAEAAYAAAFDEVRAWCCSA